GHLGKSEHSINTVDQRKVANGSSDDPKPQYRAVDGGGKTQPISSSPAVSKHPDGGYMVFFGTGTYFRTSDKVVDRQNDARNSFYAILDQGVRVTGRQQLLRQEIIFEGQVTFETASGTIVREARRVSN